MRALLSNLLVVELIFWGSILLILVPRGVLHVAEHNLNSIVAQNDLVEGWHLQRTDQPSNKIELRLPRDLRGIFNNDGSRKWILDRKISLNEIERFNRPTLVLGRIGDSDSVTLDDCEIGSTGLGPHGSQKGYWWLALRVYEIPQRCLNHPEKSEATLKVTLYKWWGSGYGIFGGPIGIGEFTVLSPIAQTVEAFRFWTLLIFGIILFIFGAYYAFVFFLVPVRSYNGIYSLCALSLGLFEVLTSTLPFHLLPTGNGLYRLLFLSAASSAVFMLWFLKERLGAINGWLLSGFAVISGLLFAAGLLPSNAEYIYFPYLLWQGVFLLAFIMAFIQFIRFWRRTDHESVWRYGLGFSALIACCIHDIVVTRMGVSIPYLIPYGFMIFAVAAGLSLAKEYADAFLHVEKQVTVRTRELADANEQLRSLDAMKQRFFANISHDFKTPIAIAAASVEEIRRVSGEAVQYAAESASKALNKLNGMVGEILDTVRAESGQLKLKWVLASPAAVIREWLEPYRILCHKKGIDLRIDFRESDTLQVPMDVAQMERVFSNLMSNAIKFTERGEIVVSLRTDTANVVLAVSDSGPGVQIDEREKVFDRFYQGFNASLREHGGSGIGLSFVKEIVDLHFGNIWIEENPPRGARFVISLPLSQDREITDEHVTDPSQTRVQPLKGSLDVPYPPSEPTERIPGRAAVLVVEDNPEVAQVVTRALTDEFNVYFARHGKDALRLLQRINVECVLSDIMMPEMSGTEFVQALRREGRFASLPVIMLSSKGEEDEVIRHLQLGAQDFVSKPFRRDVLVARVTSQAQTFRLRENLLRAERMAAIGTLAAGICHEIRNPLNNIGTAALCLSDSPDQEHCRPIAERIGRNVERADKIIRDLLRFTRKEDEEAQGVFLKPLILEVVEYLGEETLKTTQVTVEVGDDLMIDCYPNQLKQVFLNVLLNAVHAISDGGRVHVHAWRENGMAHVAVADNGSGMSDETKRRIFNPFFTTKDQGKGTGLGLYLAYHIMVRQNGSIDVESEIGKGTTVTLRVPCAA